jgi:hypothetical protein
VEVRGASETEADKSEEGCDWMDDQDGRKRFPSAGGEIEVAAGAIYIVCRDD